MKNKNNKGDECSDRALASKQSSSPKSASATEVPQVSSKRRYSYAYKMAILEEADACKKGELGALLRREGLYHSSICKWRIWRIAMNEQGAPSKKSNDKKLQQDALRPIHPWGPGRIRVTSVSRKPGTPRSPTLFISKRRIS